MTLREPLFPRVTGGERDDRQILLGIHATGRYHESLQHAALLGVLVIFSIPLPLSSWIDWTLDGQGHYRGRAGDGATGLLVVIPIRINQRRHRREGGEPCVWSPGQSSPARCFRWGHARRWWDRPGLV